MMAKSLFVTWVFILFLWTVTGCAGGISVEDETIIPTQSSTQTPSNTYTKVPNDNPHFSDTPTPTTPQTGTPNVTATHTKTSTATEKPTMEPYQIVFPDSPHELGDTLTRSIDGSMMVYVPAGTFEMGSLPDNDDWGPHTVTLDSFWIDQTEVSNAQFVELMKIKGNPIEAGMTWIEIEMADDAQIMVVGTDFKPDPGKDHHPVVEVSWYGATAYCQWIGGRLLTEAEWEYAARGPENNIYPWGNDEPTCEKAHFGGCGDYSIAVGSLSSEGNSWVGAKDMAGNVWEWTADTLAQYPSEPQINPTGPDIEDWEYKATRGGSFMSSPDTLHTAYRLRANGRSPNLGFRCAASSP